MSDRCAIDPREREAMGETFRELHEGLDADKFVCETITPPVKPLRFLGHVQEIEYEKDVLESSSHSSRQNKDWLTYWHPFEAHAQPELWVDRRGKMFVRGAHYTVTVRGIEDLANGRRTSKTHLDLPSRLVTLGKLHWIKYRNGHGSRILRFENDARPIVAHDEIGKLHFLRGNYRVEESKTMARRRYSRKGGHRAVRANPSGGGGFQRKAMTVGKMAVLVGGSFVLSGILLNKGVAFLPPSTSATVKGLVKIGAGIVIPVLAAGKVPADLLSGLAIAGVVGGGTDIYAAYRAMHPAAGLGLLGAGQPANFAGQQRMRAVAGR